MKRFFYYLLLVGLNGAFIGLISLGYLIFVTLKDLPDYKQLAIYDPPIVTRFYADDGRLLEEYAKEHRLFVPIEAIPQQVRNAFIAAEDKNFYEHPGIDLTSIGRAVIQNIVNISKNKKSLVGGSTITQQVVKNFLLTNERSLKRKIKEAVLSFRISKVYSKDRILELYLNQIYLGAGAYGVASAALAYFDKSINELSIEEAAFLAAMPKAPSTYHPKKSYKRAIRRRNWVISRMYEDGYINKEEALEAIKKPISLNRRGKSETVTADFFAESVRRRVAELYGSQTLYEGGLFVRTTLAPHYQKAADEAFRKGIIKYDLRHGYRGVYEHFDDLENWQSRLKGLYHDPALYDKELAIVLKVNRDKLEIGLEDKTSYLLAKDMNWALRGRAPTKVFKVGDIIIVKKKVTNNKESFHLRQIPKVNGGMVVMNPHDGKILAMVGGYSYINSKFNRVTQAIRQPGSAFKPFVYLSALEEGFTPSSIIEDGPIEINQGPGLPLWRPKNYYGDFLGPTTLRRGLELSRNAMTINLAQQVGINKIANMAQRFGINEDPLQVYSIVLGSMETTLLKMATAYSSVVNGGMKITPHLIEKIQDRHGKTIYKSNKQKCFGCMIEPETYGMLDIEEEYLPTIEENKENIIDPLSAYQTVSILEGVIQHTKSSRPVRSLNRTIGGKTGTTNQSKDAWFLGFTPDLVVGVYLGFDEPRSLGKYETGASAAQPIFVDFIKEALKDVPDVPFRIPPGIKLVKINYVSGKPSMADYETIYEAYKVGSEPKMIDDEPVFYDQPIEKKGTEVKEIDKFLDENYNHIIEDKREEKIEDSIEGLY